MALKSKHKNGVSHHIRRATRTVAHVVFGRLAELVSLQERYERLVRERKQFQRAQRKNETKLQDESHQVQKLKRLVRHLQESMQDRQEALTLAHRERDTAMEEKQEAQRLQSTTLELVQILQNKIKSKDKKLEFTSEFMSNRVRDLRIEVQNKDERLESRLELVRNLQNKIESKDKELEFTSEYMSDWVRDLRIEVQNKDERLIVLQQKYSHVDQEYRRLLFETGGTT